MQGFRFGLNLPLVLDDVKVEIEPILLEALPFEHRDEVVPFRVYQGVEELGFDNESIEMLEVLGDLQVHSVATDYSIIKR